MAAKIDGTNGVLQQYDYQVPTTGFSYTFGSGITVLVMNPAGTLATGTVTMPATPADGMTISISSTQAITALTVNGNSGQSIVGAPTTLTAGAAATFVYNLSNTTWYNQINTNNAGATGVPTLNVYTSPGTWTKPTTVKAIKVTVVGGGGSSGNATSNPGSGNFVNRFSTGGGGGGGAAIKVYPAPSLPGPQPYTVGAAASTSSFGVAPATVISATAGATTPAVGAPGSATFQSDGTGAAGGAGSSGDLNITGGPGQPGSPTIGGSGGHSFMSTLNLAGTTATNGVGYGAGAAGAYRNVTTPSPGTSPGATGAAGVVIVEEFY